MKITAKRLKLALRSPSHFIWAARHVLRSSFLGALERRLPGGRAFKPDLFIINITSRCNLRCAMCMQPREADGGGESPALGRRSEELSPEDWMRVVDQAADARPAFYFSGGEPLLYQGLLPLLRHIKRKGLIAAIVTNGMLLERHAKELVEIGLDNATISLDGPEEVHDRIRGVPGAFRRASRGIQALREARLQAGSEYPKLKVNCVILPENLDHLVEMRQIAREMGVEELNFQHPMFDTAENIGLHNRVFAKAMGSAAIENTDLAKGPGEYFETLFTEEQFQRIEAALDTVLGDKGRLPHVMLFPSVSRARWREYYLNLGHAFKKECGAPWTTMRLLADGVFEPCLRWRVGNVRETPIWDLWNHQRARDFRVELRRSGLFPACARCCYRRY